MILLCPHPCRYAASVTPFVRADAAARNPVCHVISSIFEGQAVVRAFQRQDIVRKDTSHVIACLRGTSLAMVNATGWLICITSVFIFNCINVVVAVSLVLALTPGPESLGPTVMSNISSLSSILTGVAIIVSSVQISSSAVQRLCLFSELPTEEDAVRHPTRDLIVQAAAAVKEAGGPDPDDSEMLLITVVEEEPPEGWPSTGSVAFRHAFAAYVWGTAPALKDVTIDIPAGSSCSIVGRSGSGKSTAFLALTGIIPVVSGAVEIDGLDVGHVPLRTLRAALAVVPQHPVLFSGSLRLNLDPHGQHGDSALWEALRAVGLIDAVTAVGGLGADPLAAGMSQGQRQLLCLARALLRDCSLLLLDEANASVDAATEQQMAVTVAAFGAGEISVVAGGAPHRRTIIEVAHRLKGCLAMDQVVVLGAGRVLEAGVPRELSKKAGGEFAGMLSAQGIEI
jgi:ABC-type multidrug transport system fused ATPase/permease subunit